MLPDRAGLHDAVAVLAPRFSAVHLGRGLSYAAAVLLGSPVIGIGDPTIADRIDGVVSLNVPPTLGEALTVIPLVVRGQQLAIHTALALGMDPDSPEGLNKVTATR